MSKKIIKLAFCFSLLMGPLAFAQNATKAEGDAPVREKGKAPVKGKGKSKKDKLREKARLEGKK